MVLEHNKIALVTRLAPEAENLWLERLRAALPKETIVPFNAISPEEYGAIEIAIVANPDPAHVALLPNLTWIHSLWAGVERLVAELGDIAIPIVRLKDPQLARTMSEAVLAWTYFLFRQMPTYAEQQRSRHWKQLPYRRPQDTTVGILGLGELGTAAAQRLAQSDFKVVAWSRSPKSIPNVESFSDTTGLDEMLSRSNILVSLLPLTNETRGILYKRRLECLPPGSSLINFGRGASLVSKDLISVLDSRQLEHAVLDVFEEEPLPPENELWAHPRISILPHVSAPTDIESATRIVAENISRYRETGHVPEAVNLSLGY